MSKICYVFDTGKDRFIMKKTLRIFLGVALFAVFLSLGAFKEVHANVELELDKEIKYDLDGNGKKEVIKYSATELGDMSAKVNVYVNGSLAYSETCELSDWYYWTEASICDINPKDKYKEVVLDVKSEFGHSLIVLRYKKKKLKLLFKVEDVAHDFKLVSEQKKGDKVLAYDASYCALGNHIKTIKTYKIKNKKLVEVKPKSQIYTVDNSPIYVEGDYYEPSGYIAARDITVYSSSDGKKSVSTIKKGTEFFITKLKYQNGNGKYALVDIKDGKKSVGWIDVEDYDGDCIVENPGFAG